MPIGVNNPYLKQKPKGATPPNNNASASAAIPPPGVAGRVAAATFSQSFSSVEDSAYFQQEQRRHLNPKDVEARAQQRAFDNAAATAASTASSAPGSASGSGASASSASEATKTTPASGLSDRDHRVMIQQPHVLYVSNRQRGNGVLNFILNVPVQFESKMVPDYMMNTTRCALFLSCKYHDMDPDYIHRRIAELKTDFTLRVLLVLVDKEDNANTLLQLNKIAVLNNMTMVCCFSEEEAGRYLETLKAFDGKDASLIQQKEATNFTDQVSDFLTTCKGVNKTDASHLVTQFGNIRAVAVASVDELGLIPGMGEVKCKRLYDAFHKPFSTRAAAARKRRKEQQQEEEEVAAKEQQQQRELMDDDDHDDDDEEEEEFIFDDTATKSDKTLSGDGKENHETERGTIDE